MTNERALAHTEPAAPIEWTDEKMRVLKQQIAPEATDEELELFRLVCDHKRLDPFSRQIYAIHRNQRNRDGSYSKKMTIQTSIDGFRLIAERTGRYLGQDGPYWCGEDGVWKDVWFSSEPPRAAKVGVWKAGAPQPTFAVAHWDEYVQTYKGKPMGLWGSMPCNQIAKCAESLALRKVFPEELSGLYTDTEMEQASNRSQPTDFVYEDGKGNTLDNQPDPKELAAGGFDPEGFDDETDEVLDGEYTEVESITEQQVKLVSRLMEDVPEDERGKVLGTYGAKSIGTLSKNGASRLIDELKKIQAAKAKAMTEEPEQDEALMSYLQDLRKLGGKPNPQVMAQATGQSARKHVVSKIRDTLIEKIEAAQTFDALSGLEVEWREHVGWTKKLQATFEEKSAALAEAGVTE